MLKKMQRTIETNVRIIPWILNSIVVITLFLSLWISIKPLYNTAIKRETQQAISAKTGLEADINNLLYRMNIAAVLTAQDPETPNLIQKALESRSDKDFESVLTKLQYYRKNARLSFIEVLGMDGTVLVNSGIKGRRNNKLNEWAVFKNTTETQNASSLAFIDNRIFATSSAMVRYEGAPVGIIVTGFELDYKWISRKSKDLTSHLAIIVNDKIVSSSLTDDNGDPLTTIDSFQEGEISTINSQPYAIGLFDIQESSDNDKQSKLGTIIIMTSLEGFFASLAQIAKTAALILAPMAILSFFVIFMIGRGMVMFTIKLARLKNKLEKILQGTKELATTREKLTASALASRYVTEEFAEKGKGDATVYLLSPPGKKSEETAIEDYSVFKTPLVRNGRQLDQFKLEPIAFSDAQFLSEVVSKGRAYLDRHKTLFVPVLMGDKPLGVLEIGPLPEITHFSSEDADFTNALASSLAISLENISFVSESQEKAKLDAELEAAKTVQEALLPRHRDFPGVDIASTFQSASQTGGDWFGFSYDPHTNKLLFYIGDVTGHGFPSALLTGVVCGAIYSSEYTTQSLLQKISNYNGDFSTDDRLLTMALTLNQVVRQTGRNRLLMTMIFLSLDLKTGEVQYLNAGHNAPYWIQSKDKKVKAIPSMGSRLGFTNSPVFTIKKFQMEPNDSLFLFTDGLIENSGPTGKLFSEKSLKNFLGAAENIDDMLSSVMHEAKRIWEDNPPADDCTSLAFTWKGPIESNEIMEKIGTNSSKTYFHHVPDLDEENK